MKEAANRQDEIRVRVPEGYEQVRFSDIRTDDHIQLHVGNIVGTTNQHFEGDVVAVGRETEGENAGKRYVDLIGTQGLGAGAPYRVYEGTPNMYFCRRN